MFASTAMGLAVAVLADRSKNEKIAKSLIFMPLAISLVGASVIWRFMYQPRDASVEQTGLLNALWVGLGRLEHRQRHPDDRRRRRRRPRRSLALLVARRPGPRPRRSTGGPALPGVAAILVGWFFLRYIGSGVGGSSSRTPTASPSPNPVGFVQESPFNNMWLMVILIWIQTGFAMVILSAAIKAVPDEIIEAARVDGATHVADLLAGHAAADRHHDRRRRHDAHRPRDEGVRHRQGRDERQLRHPGAGQRHVPAGVQRPATSGAGAALAILILFVSVLPVMIFNIRRMQREG